MRGVGRVAPPGHQGAWPRRGQRNAATLGATAATRRPSPGRSPRTRPDPVPRAQEREPTAPKRRWHPKYETSDATADT